MRSGSMISWYVDAPQLVSPSGLRMQYCQVPPTRKSISQTGSVQPLGPHQFVRWPQSDQARKTRSRGARKTRLAMKSRPSIDVDIAPRVPVLGVVVYGSVGIA